MDCRLWYGHHGNRFQVMVTFLCPKALAKIFLFCVLIPSLHLEYWEKDFY